MIIFPSEDLFPTKNENYRLWSTWKYFCLSEALPTGESSSPARRAASSRARPGAPHLQGTYWVRQEPPSDSASGIYKIIDILPDGLGSFVNFLLLFLPILLK